MFKFVAALLFAAASFAPLHAGVITPRPLGPQTLESPCALPEDWPEATASTQDVAERACVHYLTWREHNRSLAPKGELVVGTGPSAIRLMARLNGYTVEGLVAALLNSEVGQRALAWSGVHELGIFYIDDEAWSRFQGRVEEQGLPRPPDVEPSYDMVLDDGQLVILIRQGWEADPVTLLREIDYTTLIAKLYQTGVALSPDIDQALEEYLSESFPGLAPEARAIKRDIFVRLYGNLRSRRTLWLAEREGLPIDSYYRRHGIVAEESEQFGDLRSSIALLFRNDWRDIYYYGSTLFGVEIPDDLGLGQADELRKWIEANIDVEAAVRQAQVMIPDALNDAFAGTLQPSSPAYYDHLPCFVP